MGSVVPGMARGFVRPVRALVLAAAALTAACGGSSSSGPVKTYTMQGQVLSVTPERRETVVRHEEIAGFMEAMTMPYYVRDQKELEGLVAGDLITSTLVVENEGAAFLRDVKKVGNAPLERRSVQVAPGVDLLQEGDAVPDASFVDQDGNTLDFASFRGRTVVLTFIYTKCPLPTFCPLMDRNFARMQPALASDPKLAKVHLVTVSFDPATDTPEVLKRHAASLQARPDRWTFLTGPTGEGAAVERFAAAFGVSVMREGNTTEITHNLRTAIIDAKGTLVKVYTGNEWTPDQVLADLTRVATTN